MSSTPVIQQKCSKVIAKHSKSIRHKIPTTCPWASAKKATSPSHSPAIHKFLLLDEPTNGLDIPSKTILRSLLAAYADEKRTIVISTHQVREVENLIDKIVILDEQGLVLAATTEELSHRLTFGPLPADAKAIYSTPSFSGEEGIALNTTGRESRPDLELIFAATTHDRMTIPSILHTNPTNHE